MSPPRRSLLRAAGYGLGGGAIAHFTSGCFLIDVDSFRKLDIQLPAKKFVIDPAAEGLENPPVGIVPAVACTPDTVKDTCCKPPGSTQSFDCNKVNLSCAAGVCNLNLSFVNAQPVNMQMEVPQLATVNANLLQSITLKTIKYSVNNGLNVNLPAIDVYVAAAGVKSIEPGSGAEFVVQIPEQAPGFVGSSQVQVPAAGQAAFARFATNYRTPFTMLTSVKQTLGPGALIPKGKADLEISGIAEVSV